jgi:hypothetical protein
MGLTLPSQRWILSLAVCAAVLVGAAGSRADAVRASLHSPVVAGAARNISISETATLLPVGRPGHILNERGSVSGTYDGSIEAQVVKVTNRISEATITVYTNGGSLKAKGITHARNPQGAIASFTGSASISGGTGRWAHASGTVTFDGTVDRQNFHATEEIHGTVRV